METLHTRRLRLDPIAPADEAAILRFHADSRVTRLLLDTAPDTPALASLFVAWSRALNARGLGVFAARRPVDDALLGLFTLTPFGEGDEIELGGKLAPAGWGRDLAIEAGAALIDHAFDTLGHDTLISAYHPDNRAVPAILARLGFVAAGERQVFGRGAPVMHLGAACWRAQGAAPLPRRLVGSTSPASRIAERGPTPMVAERLRRDRAFGSTEGRDGRPRAE